MSKSWTLRVRQSQTGLNGSSDARRRRVLEAAAKPALELLEGRLLMSTYQWNGSVDSNWSTTGNWTITAVSGGGISTVPSPTDTDLHLVFPNANTAVPPVVTKTTVDDIAGLDVKSMLVSDSGYSFTLTNGGFTLDGSISLDSNVHGDTSIFLNAGNSFSDPITLGTALGTGNPSQNTISVANLDANLNFVDETTQLFLGQFPEFVPLGETFTGNGGYTKTGVGRITFPGNDSNYTGPTTINQGFVRILGTDRAFSGNAPQTSNQFAPNTALGDSSQPVAVTGTGTIELLATSFVVTNTKGTNTTTDDTSVIVNQPVIINQPLLLNSLGQNGAGAIDNLNFNFPGYTFNPNEDPNAQATARGNTNPPNELDGLITLAGPTGLASEGISALFVPGTITGTGSLTTQGAGSITITGNQSNSFSGGVNVLSGLLELDKPSGLNAIPGGAQGVGLAINGGNVRLLTNNQIADNARVTVNSGPGFDLSAGGSGAFSDIIGSLAGGPNGTIILPTGSNLIFGTDNTTTSYTGVISGSGGGGAGGGGTLQKQGTGTFTLGSAATGTSTFAGGTSAQGGTLLIDGLQPSSPVTLANGATLGGTGQTGTLNAQAGIINPGDPASSIGTLSVNNSLTLGGNASYTPNINPGSGNDVLNVVGTVALGGSLIPTFSSNPASGTFVIINNDGNDAVTGSFNGVNGNPQSPQGGVITLNGIKYTITYQGGDGNDVALIAGPVGTALALTANPTTVTTGGAVTLSATLTDVAGTAVAGETITFKNGNTVLGTGVTNGNGVATFTTTNLPAGSDNVNAVFAGDTSNQASSSSTVTVTVNNPALANSTTTVQASVNNGAPAQQVSAGPGQSVTLIATVSGGAASGNPTGTVQFFDNGGANPIGTGTLNAAGQATFTTSQLPSGTNNITAVYSGNAAYNPSNSGTPATVSIGQVQTQTVVAANPTSSTPGQNVTLTATVSNSAGAPANSPAPTGTVQFFNNGNAISGQIAVNNGTAVFNISNLPVGSNSITATFTSNNPASTSNTSNPTIVPVGLQTVTATLTAQPTGTVTPGQNVLFTVQVNPSGTGTGSPTGTVQLFVNGNAFGNAQQLNAGTGQAVFQVNDLPTGTDNVVAVYSGDATFGGKSTNPVTLTVQQSTSTTTVTANPTQANPGQPVTLTALVATPGSAPGGSVTFFLNGQSLGTGNVDATGRAVFTTSSLPLGNDVVTALFTGTNAVGSSAGTVTVAIGLNGTVTTLQAPATAASGQSVNLAAHVATAGAGAAGGAGPVTDGTVTFKANGVALGTVNLDSNGDAVLQTSSLPMGASAITAQYSGSSTDAVSTSAPQNITVAAGTSLTTLSSSNSPSLPGAAVTLSATVEAVAPATGTPTGTVTFKVGNTTLGTAQVNGSGVASITASNFPNQSGNNTVTATYSGSTAFTASSDTLVQVVTPSATAISVSASPANTVVGQAVTILATVTSGASTPTGAVTFKSGSRTLGTGTLNANGQASITTTTLGAGSDTITVSYAGDTTHAAGTASTIQVVAPAQTNLSVSVGGSGLPGTTTTLTATVSTVAPGTGTPDGTVQFSANGAVLGTATVTNGVATLRTTDLPVGSSAITAVYSSTSGDFATSTGAAVGAIAPAASTVAVTSSANPQEVGRPVTLIATVTGGAAFPPSGTVTFSLNGQTLATVSLNAAQQAVYTTATLPVGNDVITATYSGDTNFTAGSGQITENISATPVLPVVNIDSPSVVEGTGVNTNMVFTVTLSRPSDSPTVVTYFTADGTATGGVDYQSVPQATPGTITIPAGQTSAQISIPVFGDSVHENDETFFVNLSTSANAVIGVGQGQGTIIDDDNTAPGAGNLMVDRTPGQTSVTLSPSTTDTEGDPLQLSIVKQPANGTAFVDDGGTPSILTDDKIVYVPQTGFNGTDTFVYRVTDSRGGVATGTATVSVAPGAIGMGTDPLNTSLTDLIITGTAGKDKITVSKGKNNTVKVSMNGHNRGTFSPTGRVIIYGMAGDDTISASGMNLPVELHGGLGNDKLTGGNAADELFGDAGFDKLDGGKGRNILIGGDNGDSIKGSSKQDILIAGLTAYDSETASNHIAIGQLLAEWNSGQDYVTRVAAIQSGVGTSNARLGLATADAPATVFGDNFIDTLNAGKGTNTFFAQVLNGPVKDKIKGSHKTETIIEVDPLA